MARIKFDPEFVEYADHSTDEGGYGICNIECSFTLSVAQKGWGFGEFNFWLRTEEVGDGHGPGLYVGDEYMGLDNAFLALSKFIEGRPVDQWPMLLQKYGSVEKMRLEVTAWESMPR